MTATLSSTVRDKSGGVVPGATVTLSSPEKGFTQTFTTKPDGTYVFSLLPPGTYTLRVE
jgi:2-polyprenyl-3-methyl-5-hydroxy-6-metoxy-1,4-benzoquinol methylase